MLLKVTFVTFNLVILKVAEPICQQSRDKGDGSVGKMLILQKKKKKRESDLILKTHVKKLDVRKTTDPISAQPVSLTCSESLGQQEMHLKNH